MRPAHILAMADPPHPLKSWWNFIGAVVVVAVLYFARGVLIPITLAVLLTFILTPPVTWLERRIGRVAAVLGVVAVVFAVLVMSGWALTRQLDGFAEHLPRYRATLVSKLSQLRAAGQGGTVGELTKTIEQVQDDLRASDAAKVRRSPPSVVVLSDNVSGLSSMFSWLGPIAGLASTAGIVTTLVIFMLLDRRDLRDRLIAIVGHGHMALTTKALDEAGTRVARQLLMQTLVNGIYALASAIGLTLLGVPHALVWAAMGGVLRFIPYVGPLVGAGMPIVVSIAALDGWSGPGMVVGFFLVLELFTNLVLETVLYAGAAGVSPVGLLVSVMFWTWLWGPIGLLVATPLTVCLVVLGKHVPGVGMIPALLGDSPPVSSSHTFYQRLLARDAGEAVEVIEKHVASASPRTVYDALLVPALGMAARDRLEQRLTADEQAGVIATARELLADAADLVGRAEQASAPPLPATLAQGVEPLRVLGIAAGGPADDIALEILAHAVNDLPVRIEGPSTMVPAALAPWLVANGVTIVCITDMPPTTASRSRYFVRRLRALVPDLTILVARWAPPDQADETIDVLVSAGANHVASRVEQTRAYLMERARQVGASVAAPREAAPPDSASATSAPAPPGEPGPPADAPMAAIA